LFWFLFWFGRWFHPISDDVRKPIEKADYTRTSDCIEAFEGKKMVREERVELSTFGSGGRRSIQLSYSRNRPVSEAYYAAIQRGGKQIRYSIPSRC
jgi:hypothetical protein